MTNEEFCENVLSLIGQPYTQTDCIGVVRKAAKIRCQGTNWLWRSYTASGKYKYLVERDKSIPAVQNAINGTLVFRIKWGEVPPGYTDKPNCYHVGVIIDGDVIQSNPSTGVYRSAYIPSKWDGSGWLKQIEKPVSNTPSAYPPTLTDDIPPTSIDDIPLTDREMLTALYRKIIMGESID